MSSGPLRQEVIQLYKNVSVTGVVVTTVQVMK